MGVCGKLPVFLWFSYLVHVQSVIELISNQVNDKYEVHCINHVEPGPIDWTQVHVGPIKKGPAWLSGGESLYIYFTSWSPPVQFLLFPELKVLGSTVYVTDTGKMCGIRDVVSETDYCRREKFSFCRFRFSVSGNDFLGGGWGVAEPSHYSPFSASHRSRRHPSSLTLFHFF